MPGCPATLGSHGQAGDDAEKLEESGKAWNRGRPGGGWTGGGAVPRGEEPGLLKGRDEGTEQEEQEPESLPATWSLWALVVVR